MKCSICDGDIPKHFSSEGKMIWAMGHNPAPVKTGEKERCCDNCNSTVVIPARLVGQLGMLPDETLAKVVEEVGRDTDDKDN